MVVIAGGKIPFLDGSPVQPESSKIDLDIEFTE
jgi:hypothetical protein